MLELGGYGHGLAEIDVEWPLHEVFPEHVSASGNVLLEIFRKANAVDRRWNEEDTIQKLILKVLTKILWYQEDDISRTPHPKIYYGQKRLDVDMIISSDLILEAKAVKIPLLSMNKDYGDFSNAIDQGLSYLDNYGVNHGIITNGWDWYLFKKTENWDLCSTDYRTQYFGVRFRLDEIAEARDAVRLSQFVSIFNSFSMSGMVNQRVVIKGCAHKVLSRNLYSGYSDLYFRNFSTRPLKGHGSGFRFFLEDKQSWELSIHS